MVMVMGIVMVMVKETIMVTEMGIIQKLEHKHKLKRELEQVIPRVAEIKF
jgi:hypothetical protein